MLEPGCLTHSSLGFEQRLLGTALREDRNKCLVSTVLTTGPWYLLHGTSDSNTAPHLPVGQETRLLSWCWRGPKSRPTREPGGILGFWSQCIPRVLGVQIWSPSRHTDSFTGETSRLVCQPSRHQSIWKTHTFALDIRVPRFKTVFSATSGSDSS